MRQILSVVAVFWLFGFAGAVEAQTHLLDCQATPSAVFEVWDLDRNVIIGGAAALYAYDGCTLDVSHTPGDAFGVEVGLFVSRPSAPSVEIDLDLQYRGIPREIEVSLLKATWPVFERITVLPLASDGIFHASVKVDNLADYLQAGGYLRIRLEVMFQLPDTETTPCECDLDIDWVDEKG